MDQATRRQRARNKQLARKNADGLAENQIEPKGLGRKLKPSEKFPNRQCDYRIGGTEVLLRRNRKTKKRGQEDFYFIPLVVGGQRCVKSELSKNRCLEHIGATYERKQKD